MSSRPTRRQFLGATAGAGAAAGLAAGATSLGGFGARGDVPARLKILVLGGTGQTGPHFIRQALAHGHEVTMCNRGNRSSELFPDVECIVGDRAPENPEGLAALREAVDAGRRWDVALDVWPHIPKIVETTADLLKESVDRYMFVSSISVYVDSSKRDEDETAEVGEAPDADNTEFNWSLFGPFKAECENRVRRIYGDRYAVFRPGLIVGPRDFSFRGGYWPVRMRHGGSVLAPGDGETRTQLIDARDLVSFQLLCMERGIGGTYNVTGPHPHNPLTMRKLLEACKRVGDSDAEMTWVPAEFLQEHGVGPWMQMPCWLPSGGEYDGFGSRNIDRAIGAGLTLRPLSATIEDTLQWYDDLPETTRAGMNQRAGITLEKEAEVLEAWASRESNDGDEG